LVTTRIPAAAAVPGPAEGAEGPEGEEAEGGEVEPFSALRFSRFLFFLEDMIRRQPRKAFFKKNPGLQTNEGHDTRDHYKIQMVFSSMLPFDFHFNDKQNLTAQDQLL